MPYAKLSAVYGDNLKNLYGVDIERDGSLTRENAAWERHYHTLLLEFCESKAKIKEYLAIRALESELRRQREEAGI